MRIFLVLEDLSLWGETGRRGGIAATRGETKKAE